MNRRNVLLVAMLVTQLVMPRAGAQVLDAYEWILRESSPEAFDEEDGNAVPDRIGPIELGDIRDPGLRMRIEELAIERGIRRTPVRQMVDEPWLSESGEPLVGVVGDRYLTRRQLQQRVAPLIANIPRNADPVEQESRIVITESALLQEWIVTIAIAEYARMLGITFTEQEVNETLEDLLQQASEAVRTGSKEGSLFSSYFPALSERELRQEVEDALLVDKAVRRGMDELVTEEELRKVYNLQPSKYHIPTRVRAVQLFLPVVGRKTPRQEEAIIKMMNRWKRELERANTPEQIQKLANELESPNTLIDRDRELTALANMGVTRPDAVREPDKPVLQNLGLVAEGDILPKGVSPKLFALKAGQTSEVFRTDLGYHVLRVYQREEGEERSFEAARPRVQAMLYDYVRERVFQAASVALPVYSNSGGLKKWREVEVEPEMAPAATQMVDRASEPDLSALRAAVNGTAPVAPAQSSTLSGTRNSALNVPPVEQVLQRRRREQEQQLQRERSVAPAASSATAPAAPAAPAATGPAVVLPPRPAQ